MAKSEDSMPYTLRAIRNTARRAIDSKFGASICNIMGYSNVVHLRNCGMFSNVNEIVERLRLFENNGKKFYVNWTDSPYRLGGCDNNVWGYYFEQPFDIDGYGIFSPRLEPAETLAFNPDNIIAPHQDYKLMLPTNRRYAQRLIDEYIKPKRELKAKIDSLFPEVNFKRVIAAHVRGRGFIQHHGDTAERRKLDTPNFFNVYFDAIDKIFAAKSHDRVLICSDSADVIEAAHARYGDRMISYAAQRSAFGEMHHEPTQDMGSSFDKYLLGEDVIVEAFLMSRCEIFVHARSSVVNFVLCNNPDMRSEFVL